MDVKTFYKGFIGLDSQLVELNKQVKETDIQLSSLEQRLQTRKFMKKVITHLQSGQNERDPGKYGPAFYFVQEIRASDVRKADEPTVYHPCSTCGREQPVLMSYEQTYDSPEGDTWEKKAFIICADGTYQELARVDRDYRF